MNKSNDFDTTGMQRRVPDEIELQVRGSAMESNVTHDDETLPRQTFWLEKLQKLRLAVSRSRKT